MFFAENGILFACFMAKIPFCLIWREYEFMRNNFGVAGARALWYDTVVL
jgi:hypothetical protein